MDYQEFLNLALDFATAILLGALVGIEREKRKRRSTRRRHRRPAHLHPAIACSARAAGWLSHETSSPWMLAAALLVVGALVSRRLFRRGAHRARIDNGLTTEVAGLVVFLLGAMVMFGLPGARHRPCRRHRRGARL